MVKHCLLLIAAISALGGQTANLQFEVATIKPNVSPSKPYPSGVPDLPFLTIDRDRFNVPDAPLKSLLAYAYRVSRFQISGPKWLESTRYDISAKLPEIAPLDQARDQARDRMRSLLAARFGVVTHRDKVEMNVYAITIAGKEPKIKSIEDGGSSNFESARRPLPSSLC